MKKFGRYSLDPALVKRTLEGDRDEILVMAGRVVDLLDGERLVHGIYALSLVSEFFARELILIEMQEKLNNSKEKL